MGSNVYLMPIMFLLPCTGYSRMEINIYTWDIYSNMNIFQEAVHPLVHHKMGPCLAKNHHLWTKYPIDPHELLEMKFCVGLV